jgi:pimeloyl-ACP methyl ester carboxylesterase
MWGFMRTLLRLEVVAYELMRRRRFPRTIAVVVAGMILAACGGDDSSESDQTDVATTVSAPDATSSTAPSATTNPPFPVEPIEWTECGSEEVPDIECATLEVPFDYEDPNIGAFSLNLKKRPADKPDKSRGVLLVNRGGPGAESASMAPDAEFYFTQTLLDHFDIVAFDPRGVGATEPHVDCVDDYDPYFTSDATPDTPEERQKLIDDAKAFNDACLDKSGAILPYISTRASAMDMDSIRRALGEDKVSYFGFSYGSELGAMWTSLYPDTVRAAVFDGASDPNASYLQAGLDQAAGFERQLNSFFADCAKRTTCAIHNNGKPAAVFDELMRRLDRDPLFVSDNRTLVTQTVGYTAAVDAMYSDALWPTFAEAIQSATDPKTPDGTGLLALFDDYYQRRPDGSYDNLLEAFTAISCLDDRGETSRDAVDSHLDEFLQVAPRLGGFFASGYTCALWPVESLGRKPLDDIGTGPIVVVGTTGDAATPLESSRKMAAALRDGRLIVVMQDQHTGYGTSDCVNTLVDAYLVDLKAPETETTCSAEAE